MLTRYPTLSGGLTALGEAIRALRTEYAFVIRLSKGQVEISRGSVPPKLLRALCGVFETHHLKSGWVAGIVENGLRIRLVMTGAWPIDVRQMLRNAWAAAA